MATRQRALLVEDDDAVRRVLASFLAVHEIDTLEAVDGRDGLAKARSKAPDLVICDVMMPHLDGIEMVRLLRADGGRNATVPVLFVSGVVNAVPADELGPGTVELMLKPVDMHQFVERVRAMLRREAEPPDA